MTALPCKSRFALTALVMALCLALLPAALAGPAAAAPQPALPPGLYQTPDALASCRVDILPDGSCSILLWQGGASQESGPGFALLARLVPARDNRLAGAFQSLPGSCCPVLGRLEVLAQSPGVFKVTSFAPAVGPGPWRVTPDLTFRRVSEPPKDTPWRRLAGKWRLAYWYTDLLPGNAPSDFDEAWLDLRAEGETLHGLWLGLPGQATLTPSADGARLEYRDQGAGFSLEADLLEHGGGLALAGSFRSTLGSGQMRLVRQGLPANPPGADVAPAEGGQELSGLWVDPRSGSDFYEITGSAKELRFTAYGGSRQNPRYLTQGQATADGGGALVGAAQDQPGYCCGNQGRVRLRPLADGRLEAQTVWWPKGAPEPNQPADPPFVLERAHAGQHAPSAERRRGWPLIVPARPGLPAVAGGALRVSFVWRPDGEARAHALFSQGGYGRDLDLFIDRQGRLAAEVATTAGPLTLHATKALDQTSAHEAWLIYQAGGQAALWLDGQEQDRQDMAAPWTGSPSPYIVGGSRWPGREFRGEISSVELWATAQSPGGAAPADLKIVPGQPVAEAGPEPQPTAAPQAAPAKQTTLVRLWHPQRLLHAYAADQQTIERLTAADFQPQGPVCRLWNQGGQGMVGLWAHVNRATGQTLISKSPESPAGFALQGLLGHASPKPGQGLAAIHALAGQSPPPLGKGPAIQDNLYTTRADMLATLRDWGYRETETLAHAAPADEPAPTRPVSLTWDGVWQGDGWGRFFVRRQGGQLFMFWYYSTVQGPHFFGRYALSADGRKAQGLAVGKPGPGASFYRHELELDLDAPDGPRLKITAWRLAAPLDDGRLVLFKGPKPNLAELQKTAQDAPPTEQKLLMEAIEGLDPALMQQQALQRAREQNRLVER